MSLRGLWKLANGRVWLWGNLTLALVGMVMLSKSLTNFLLMSAAVLLPFYLCFLTLLSPGVYRFYGRTKGDLQSDSWQHMPPRNAASSSPVLAAGHCGPSALQETLRYSQAGLAQSLVMSLLIFPGSTCTRAFLFALQESLFLPFLWEFCNQILLSFKVKFPGDSHSVCWIPMLGHLIWGLEF